MVFVRLPFCYCPLGVKEGKNRTKEEKAKLPNLILFYCYHMYYLVFLCVCIIVCTTTLFPLLYYYSIGPYYYYYYYSFLVFLFLLVLFLYYCVCVCVYLFIVIGYCVWLLFIVYYYYSTLYCCPPCLCLYLFIIVLYYFLLPMCIYSSLYCIVCVLYCVLCIVLCMGLRKEDQGGGGWRMVDEEDGDILPVSACVPVCVSLCSPIQSINHPPSSLPSLPLSLLSLSPFPHLLKRQELDLGQVDGSISSSLYLLPLLLYACMAFPIPYLPSPFPYPLVTLFIICYNWIPLPISCLILPHLIVGRKFCRLVPFPWEEEENLPRNAFPLALCCCRLGGGGGGSDTILLAALPHPQREREGGPLMGRRVNGWNRMPVSPSASLLSHAWTGIRKWHVLILHLTVLAWPHMPVPAFTSPLWPATWR